MNKEHNNDLEIQNRALRDQLMAMETRLGCLQEEHERMRETALHRRAQAAQRFFDAEAQEAGLPELFAGIQEELAGSTLDEVFERWTKQVGPSGNRGDAVTVIPGRFNHRVCTPQVVVFVRCPLFRLGSHGGQESSTDPFETLKLQLETCRIVRGVLFIFEWSAAPDFDKSIRRWIRAWKSRGIAFALGVCGPDGSTLQPFPTGI